MKGIIILLFILGIIGLIVNGISYFANNKVSLLRILLIMGGLRKNYGEILKEKGLTIKSHDCTYDWRQTEFGDFRIGVDIIDNPNRQSYRYRLIVDKNGNLIEGLYGDNDKFLVKLGLKEPPTQTNHRRYY